MKRYVVADVETWVHYFEPVRKVSNKLLATKNSKRPIIAKRILRAKTALYAILFSGEGIAIQVPVKNDTSDTGIYYKDVVLKKWRPAPGFKHVRLLHDDASAHTSAFATKFCKKRE